MFSGLNLAFFSVTKLRLEIESKKNNLQALKVARLRQNSNFLLTTILWGNVGINVLLFFYVCHHHIRRNHTPGLFFQTCS